MDGSRFDDLTRRLASGRSRRQVLTAIGAGLSAVFAGGLGRKQAEGAGCGGEGDGCSDQRKCCGLACLNGICCPKPRICGNACCPAGYTCQDGACVKPGQGNPGGCPGGQARCNGACTDLTTISNCGACGRQCSAPANATATCVNGVCGFACNAGYQLCDGVCTDVTTTANCGACGHVCAAPANGTATCDGSSCGFSCDGGFSPCGGGCCPSGLACCDGTCCGAGETCSAGVCAPCSAFDGGIGDDCLSQSACCGGLDCVNVDYSPPDQIVAFGAVCQVPGCLTLRDGCDPGNNACCKTARETGSAICAPANSSTAGEARCCLGVQTYCRDNSECCAGTECRDPGSGTPCGGGTEICGWCCLTEGGGCVDDSQCCVGLACNTGVCG